MMARIAVQVFQTQWESIIPFDDLRRSGVFVFLPIDNEEPAFVES